jgi:hypothetical protein
MAHSKAPPTLYDNFAATGLQVAGFDKATLERVVRPLLAAQKYVLDEEASSFLGDMLKQITPLVLAQHEFARTPYPNTWIEFHFPPYMKALDGRDPDDTGDTRVGFFINERNSMFSVSETKTSKPAMLPMWFDLHHPISFEEELEMANRFGLSRMTYRQMILGTTSIYDDWWKSDAATAFCRSHRLRIGNSFADVPTHALQTLLRGSAGSLKQGIALLLLLTRPGQAVLKLHEQDRRRGIIRGQSRVLAPHHTVTLHLKRDMAMQKVIEALHSTGRHNRLHDVRGHWCQTRNPKYRGCDHDFQPVDINHYECIRPGCKAKRWWKKNHPRGDASLGKVDKTYEVTE